jgi:hypothetical protein
MNDPTSSKSAAPSSPAEPIVIRGGVEIDAPRDDARKSLIALLALGLRLDNVGVFPGAGASCGAGGKTMKDVWSAFSSSDPKTIEWLRGAGLLPKNDDPTILPNIEELATRLDLRIEVYRETKDTKLTDAQAHRAAIQRAIMKAAVLDEGLWKTKTAHGGPQVAKLNDHSCLLARLLGSRQPGQNAPWIFTINYDLAVEWAAENLGIHVVTGFSGTHFRRFDPSSFDLGLMNLQSRGEARFGTYNLFLAKLHGSLSWIQEGGDLIERPAREAWSEINEFLTGNTADPRATIIMPNTAKYVNTTGFAYGEMLRRFSEFMSRRSTLLIISGYGFGDDHINRLLLSGLRNPTLQVVLYMPELIDASTITNPVIAALNDLKTKQVVLVGGGENAWFTKLAGDMPDPGHFDATAEEARKLARVIEALASAAPSGTPKGTP